MISYMLELGIGTTAQNQPGVAGSNVRPDGKTRGVLRQVEGFVSSPLRLESGRAFSPAASCLAVEMNVVERWRLPLRTC